jgi:LmbE family N-acetylglucosaminyl deacetylase
VEQALKSLVIVAHPDDETIWMGGLIIRHPEAEWQIISLCRANDEDRSSRFFRAANALNARALISDLDDSPTLLPLSRDLREIKERIMPLVEGTFDLIFTHGPRGEYTRHVRHEQAHRAVAELVENGRLSGSLISFAYEDDGGRYTPRPAEDASILVTLSSSELSRKRHIIRNIYGFREDSFEFKAAGNVEAFRGSPEVALDFFAANTESSSHMEETAFHRDSSGNTERRNLFCAY